MDDDKKAILSIDDLPGFFIGRVRLNDDNNVEIVLSKRQCFNLICLLVDDLYICNKNTTNSKEILQSILRDHTGVNFDIPSAYDKQIEKRKDKEKKKDNAWTRLLSRIIKYFDLYSEKR